MDKNAFDSSLGATFEDLDALLEADSRRSTTDLLDLSKIEPGPWQPRKYFDPKKLESLADTIVEHMQLDPILVWRSPDRDIYLLVAGERRWRAHKLLCEERGLEVFSKIEARILPNSLGEEEIWELAVISNDAREDIDPFDEAAHYQTLIDTRGYTQEKVAQLFSKSQQSISEELKIPKLPKVIREEYRALDNGVPKSFLTLATRIPDEAEQLAFWQEVKIPNITFREAQAKQQERTKRLKQKHKQPAKKSPSTTLLMASGKDFAKRLENLAAEDVSLSAKKVEQLEALYERITEALTALVKQA